MAACYSYSISKGLFAGVSLEGSVIISRQSMNKKFYGKDVNVRDLLSGSIPSPPAAAPLYESLTKAFNTPGVLRHRPVASTNPYAHAGIAGGGMGAGMGGTLGMGTPYGGHMPASAPPGPAGGYRYGQGAARQPMPPPCGSVPGGPILRQSSSGTEGAGGVTNVQGGLFIPAAAGYPSPAQTTTRQHQPVLAQQESSMSQPGGVNLYTGQGMGGMKKSDQKSFDGDNPFA